MTPAASPSGDDERDGAGGPAVLSTGWAAGVNAYATVALLCVAGRANLLELPAAFARTDVLVASLVLFAVELVADKVPLLDSGWDVVQTVARPLIGGTTGALLAGTDGADALLQTAAAGGSGALSLASHSVKASIRLAVNTSPEPLSNVLVSTAEDAAVALVVMLATKHPWAAAAIAMTLLVLGTLLAVVLAKKARAGLRRVRQRQRGRAQRGPPGAA